MSSGAWVDKYKLTIMCNDVLSKIDALRHLTDATFIQKKLNWLNFFRKITRRKLISFDPKVDINYEYWITQYGFGTSFAESMKFPTFLECELVIIAESLLKTCELSAEDFVFVSAEDLFKLDRFKNE